MPPRIQLVEKWSDLSDQLAESQGDKPILSETEYRNECELLKLKKKEQEQDHHKINIVWRNVLLMTALHLGAILGLKECLYLGSAQWKTVIFGYLLYNLSGLGITAGSHRLWSHRSYKATWPLRILLAFFNTIAFENSIYEWTRDHRVHHKYTETDADPHDSRRGFFFSHVGWLLCRKHPDVKLRGKTIDMSDLEADPIVRFQHQHYLKLVALCCFIIPTVIPYLFWAESIYNAFYICTLLRYVVTLHCTWLINSAAHMWGRRPYDQDMGACENRAAALGALGEGFHNYHHVFPWDYAASELGYDLNITKLFIDFFATFGWVYERKVASPGLVKQRKLRTGDVSRLGVYGKSHHE